MAATSFATTDDVAAAFVRGYREAGGNAPAAGPLAMAVELLDLDWLLRNVEACLRDPADRHAHEYRTAQTLIEGFPRHVEALRAWPAQLDAAGN